MHKGLADSSLLESYTTERLPVITEMLGRTTAILNKTITFKTDSEEENPFVRPKILHQLGVNCRWSPILVDEQPEARNDGVLQKDRRAGITMACAECGTVFGPFFVLQFNARAVRTRPLGNDDRPRAQSPADAIALASSITVTAPAARP